MDYNEALATATDQQKRWFWAWIETLDPTEAAREAGYAVPKHAGWENRHNPKLKPAIDAFLETLAMPAHEVIARYYEMASSSMRDFITFTSELPEDQRKPQTAVTTLEGGNVANVPVLQDGPGFRLDLEKAKRRGKLGNIKKLTETKRQWFDRGRGAWVTETQTAVELYSKKDALDKLGEYYGIWKTGNNITVIKNEIVAFLRSGQIEPGKVIEELGEDLAKGLFLEAGIVYQQEELVIEQPTENNQQTPYVYGR